MEKVKLEIVGLSYSQTQSGAYALVLSEENGNRRIPIIIGGYEAQSIAIELENMKPSRPLTHDLLKTFADQHEIKVAEVIIYNLSEGIFYAKIICEQNGTVREIDARTSDAIALAVRVNCPIFTFENIISSAGIDFEDAEELNTPTPPVKKEDHKEKGKDINSLTIKELEEELNKAIETENYERASKLRDEINRRSS